MHLVGCTIGIQNCIFQFHKMWGILLLAVDLLSFQEGFCLDLSWLALLQYSYNLHHICLHKICISRYLYKEGVQLQSIPTALHTLYVTVKNQCGGLVKMCVLYFDSKLDSSSVLEVYRDLPMYCDSTLSPQITI